MKKIMILLLCVFALPAFGQAKKKFGTDSLKVRDQIIVEKGIKIGGIDRQSFFESPRMNSFNEVLTTGIASNAINESNINDNQVTSIKIANGTITNIDIALNSILGAAIQNGSITAVDIANGTIDTTKISGQFKQWVESAGGGSVENNVDDQTLKVIAGEIIGLAQEYVDSINTAYMKHTYGRVKNFLEYKDAGSHQQMMDSVVTDFLSKPNWTLKIPNGVWNLDSLNFKTPVSIVGNGDSTILNMAAGSANIIEHNFRIMDLKVIGGAAPLRVRAPATGIDLLWIENVTFTGQTWHTVEIENDYAANPIERVVALANTFIDTEDGFKLKGNIRSSYFAGNLFKRIVQPGDSDVRGIRIGDVDYQFPLSGNRLEGYHILMGNRVDSLEYQGTANVEVNGFQAVGHQVVLIGNVVTRFNGGLSNNGEPFYWKSEGATVIGNSVNQATYLGNAAFADKSALSGSRIIGNSLQNCSGIGIFSHGLNTIVALNQIETDSTGISFAAVTAGDSTHNHVFKNRINSGGYGVLFNVPGEIDISYNDIRLWKAESCIYSIASGRTKIDNNHLSIEYTGTIVNTGANILLANTGDTFITNNYLYSNIATPMIENVDPDFGKLIIKDNEFWQGSQNDQEILEYNAEWSVVEGNQFHFRHGTNGGIVRIENSNNGRHFYRGNFFFMDSATQALTTYITIPDSTISFEADGNYFYDFDANYDPTTAIQIGDDIGYLKLRNNWTHAPIDNLLWILAGDTSYVTEIMFNTFLGTGDLVAETGELLDSGLTRMFNVGSPMYVSDSLKITIDGNSFAIPPSN